MPKALRKHPLIALVEEEFFHPAPKPMATRGGATIARHINEGRKRKAKIAMPWGIKAVNAPDAWQVTKGEGARVMVLDTGVDATHPALKNSIEQTRNFTSPDSADTTDDVGHGTHVAGTILADGRGGGLVGVAPAAKLLMGKVCILEGCSNVAIAAGVNWAIQEHVDVVNMSLGGSLISEGEARAIKMAEQVGVMIVAATGNDGTARVSYPAAMDSVFAVGAIDQTLARAAFSQYGPQLDIMGPGVDVLSAVPAGTGREGSVFVNVGGKGLMEVKSKPFVGSPLGVGAEIEVVFANLGKPENFAGLDVSGKVVLIARGEIPFVEKVENAVRAGAAGVLIYNNVPGLLQGAITEDGSEGPVPAAMIEQGVGDAMKTALQSGRAVSTSLTISASDYASFQGTSMATPHVAGVAALVRSVNRTLNPDQVRNLMKATALALGTVDQYGAGLVNARAAVAQAQADMPLSFLMAN